jgi:nitrate/nitrite-specific signal transduction histidine kinase
MPFKFPTTSLAMKIVLWAFVPAAIILVAVALITFLAYQQVTEELVLERDREVTRLTAGQIAGDLIEYSEQLESVARSVGFVSDDVDAQMDALEGAKPRLSAFDGGVFILDSFGVVVASDSAIAGELGRDWSDHSFYRELVRSRVEGVPRPAFSGLIREQLSESSFVITAVAIIGEQDEFRGLIVGMFVIQPNHQSVFFGTLESMSSRDTGEIYILDSIGNVLYHTDSGLITDDFSASPVLEALPLGELGAERLREGEDIVASVAPVPGTDWTLVMEESWASLTSASQGYRDFLLILLGLGILVPTVVVAVGLGRILDPVRALIDAAQEVARGEFGRRINADTGDEIEELATQFNIMSAELAESYTTLERRVEDRTRELSTLNAIAAVVSRTLNLKHILSDALEKTVDLMELEAGGIGLQFPGEPTLTIEAHIGLDEQLLHDIDETSLESTSALDRLIRESGFRLAASVPLVSRGQTFGTLFIASRKQKDLTPQDVELLSSIGHHIGLAVQNARLYNAEQRRAEQFRVVTDVARRLTSILEVDTLLKEMVHLIKESFGYYLVELGVVEGEQVIYRSGAGGDWEEDFESFSLDINESTISGTVAATGEPLLVAEVSEDPRYYRARPTKTVSELAVPIRSKGEVIGVLNVESDRPRAFDKGDVEVLQSLAHHAAIAIQNAELFRSEHRRAEQFRVISEVGRHITSILDVDQLLYEIATLLKETFGYYLITIGLIEGDEIIFKAGAKTHWRDPVFRPPSLKVGGHGITAWVAQSGEPLLAPDVSKEPRFAFLEDAAETRSELAVALKTQSGILGVLNVESDQLNAFDESDVVVLQSLALQAAVAIENARLYEQGRELAVLEERSRLARDLHDAVTQTLFSASIIAEVLPRLWVKDGEEGMRRLEELRQLTRGALAEMRTLLVELRPADLEDAQLGELLQQLAEATSGRSRLPVEVQIDKERDLPLDVKIVFYRIAQEALNNIVKHSGANKVSIHLDASNDKTKLDILDDGKGFDSSSIGADHFGLSIMRERVDRVGAELNIQSGEGQGTTIHVAWSAGDDDPS